MCYTSVVVSGGGVDCKLEKKSFPSQVVWMKRLFKHTVHVWRLLRWAYFLCSVSAVRCPVLDNSNVSAGGLNCSDPIGPHSYNSTCEIRCNAGYEPSGQEQIQCDHSGQWTASMPTCRGSVLHHNSLGLFFLISLDYIALSNLVNCKGACTPQYAKMLYNCSLFYTHIYTTMYVCCHARINWEKFSVPPCPRTLEHVDSWSRDLKRQPLDHWATRSTNWGTATCLKKPQV